MKITSVDIIEVGNDFQTAVAKWRPVVVRINTDEGLSGYGEIGLAYGFGASAGFGMAKDLAALLIGQDPMKSEAIWERLFKKTFWGQGGGGVVFGGMSGIDIALWDLKGKALGVPVSQLLGGKTRDKVRTYASQLQFGWGLGRDKAMLVEPEEYAEVMRIAVAEGYTAIKVDPLGMAPDRTWNQQTLTGSQSGKVLRMGYERLKAMREAVGPDIDIIAEMHAFTDTTSAIQFGQMIAELGIFYYEEPTMALNPGQMRLIADKVDIPLAAGERIYSRWGFRPFFENGSLRVIQPDLGTCGGLSEGKKICDMAHVYDVTVQIHVCGGPMATAAALQIEAAIPNFIIHELHRYALLEANTDSCVHNYLPVDGYYQVPDLPGLGQELTPEAVKRSLVVTVQ